MEASAPGEQVVGTRAEVGSQSAQAALQEQYTVGEAEPFRRTSYNSSYDNVVTFVGVLKDDPEMKPIQGYGLLAKLVLSFKQGRTKSQTGWVTVDAWSPLAEQCAAHLRSGTAVQIQGSLRMNQWTDSATQKQRSALTVVASEIWTVDDKDESIGSPPHDTAQLWEAYRQNPQNFWDNRTDKRNPRAPDFKHKDTGKGLWLISKYRPSWISETGELL